MKKFISVVVLLHISGLANAQNNIEFEKEALKFFVKNRTVFGLNSKDTIYTSGISQQTLKIDIFLSNTYWHEKGIVRKNAYLKNDSIFNSRRSNIYVFKIPTAMGIAMYDKNIKTPNYFASVFKRFFYDSFVYVYIEAKSDLNPITHTTLFKFDLKGKMIDHLSSSYQQ